MNILKQTIKQLAAGQRGLKNQRKTIKIEGTRTMTAREAFFVHQNNRYELRLLNVTYGILRGKTVEEMESNAKEPVSMAQVNKLVDKYKEEVCKD